MTMNSDAMEIEKRTVVFFDICSSSKILEDLMLSGNLRAMRRLILSMRTFLIAESQKGGFDVYKFIGDGWILLFPRNIGGEALVTFLDKLSRTFTEGLKKHVLSRLQSTPSVIGLTFGIDHGDLVKLVMMGKTEYIGRPLNIASRLQSAISQRDKNPAYKVLLSKPCFKALRFPDSFRPYKEVTRTLRNIQGGERYACIKMKLKH